MRSFDISRQLFREANQIFPGGVNSPVRAFKAVGGEPLFIERGVGAYLYDADGNRYIDYVGSWGPMILGHAHPPVVAAISKTANLGTSFGAPSHLEIDLGKAIQGAMPHLEMMRFVSSGTEAVMSALRLAWAYTGRNKVIKFEGGYHGHSDGLLSKSGSGLATLGIPDSAGVPASFAAETLTANYNDLDSLEALFDRYPNDIAAVILEPVAANMGVVLPQSEFLEALREITRERGTLLIFDEVITGFRIGFGGAVQKYKVTPDLTTLGKIIGGGLPVGAYGGRADIMRLVAPLGPVYQAGTLSGNPVAMAAGLATIKGLENPEIYALLDANSASLAEGISSAGKRLNIPIQINRVASLMTVFFTKERVSDYRSAKTSNVDAFRMLHGHLIQHGIYWPPSQFEAAFISSTHSDGDIVETLEVFGKGLKKVKDRLFPS